MRHHRKTEQRHTRLLATLSLAAAIVAAGCSGHGRYTNEGRSLAQQRVSSMKAATEYDMARQAFLAGELDKARRRIDASIMLNNAVPRSHVLRGRILQEKGNFEESIRALQLAIELDPESNEAHYYLAFVYERGNQHEEALEMYLRAEELDPSNAQYVIAASEVMVDMNRVDEAREYLAEAGERFKQTGGVRQVLGHIAMLEERFEDAVDLFNEARLLTPDEPTILEDLADALIATRRFAEAEHNLARLMRDEANKKRRDLKHARARCLIELDRPVEARQLYIELTDDDNGASDIEAWVGLGRVAHKLGDRNRLRRAAARVTSLAPDRNEGYILRALWQRRTGDDRGALVTLENGLKRVPDDHTMLSMKGLVEHEMGLESAARSSFRAALRVKPDDRLAGRFLAAMGDSAYATAPTDQ